jgi:hypothetical protein
MKFTADRPYVDREAAARKIMKIPSTIEPVQDGHVHIEKINEPFLYKERSSPAGYGAGSRLAIECGWLWLHESETCVKITPTSAELFA